MTTISRPSFLALLASAPLAAAAGLPAFAQGAPLRVGATANDTYAEAYYAQDEGFFRKAGLNVELTTFPNGGAVSTAMAGGAIDIGISNPVQLATAVTHGINFAYIAAGGLYATEAPTTVLCVAKASPLRVAKDLEGKTVALSQLRDITALGAQAWLEANGADVSKIRFTEMPFAQMGPALERGTVDAATISEPSLSANREGVRTFGKMFDVFGPRFLISGWFAKTDWIARNKETTRRFAETIYATGKWANENRPASGEILAKYAKLTPETIARITRCRYAETMDPVWLHTQLDLAYKRKFIDRPVPASELLATL